MIGLGENLLKRLYQDMGYSDNEISTFLGVDRTLISRLRSQYGIKSRLSLGELGERYVIKKLTNLGYEVKDMNEKDKTFLFDILVNNHIKIEVKTAKNSNGYFKFSLTNKPENMHIESDHRVILPNGRSKKLLRKTCELVVFVGVDENNKKYPYVIPPAEIRDNLQTLSIPLNKDNRFSEYFERWSLLEYFNKQEDAI